MHMSDIAQWLLTGTKSRAVHTRGHVSGTAIGAVKVQGPAMD